MPFFFFLVKLIVNRRLDEWVKLEQLDLDSVQAAVVEKVEDKVVACSRQKTPSMKPFLFDASSASITFPQY